MGIHNDKALFGTVESQDSSVHVHIMKAGKDFIYVTQKDNILFMWRDEPINTENGWRGKYPYVNNVLYKKIKETIGDRKLNEPEMITW